MIADFNSHQFLLITLGMPGAGKTYFSSRFAKECHFFHLNSDRVRLSLFETPDFSLPETISVFRSMAVFTEELLSQGFSIILDANMNKALHRHQKRRWAENFKAHFLIIWFDIPITTAKERVSTRLHEIPAEKYTCSSVEVVDLHSQGIEFPTEDEVYVKLDGTLPYEKQREIVIGKLKQMIQK